MNSFIFSILAIAFVVNALYFPVVTILDYAWAFVSRTSATQYANKWQDTKWNWCSDMSDGMDEQWFRWFIVDFIVCAFCMVMAAFMGAVGLLSWFVGIPLVIGGALYGVRWFMDSKS